MATKLLIIALILLTCLSYLSAYLPDKEHYLNLLDEIDNSLDNIRNYEVDRNHDETEYKPFFDSLFNHELETELKPKRIQKRFIKSLIELLKPKNKTKPTPHANDHHDFFDSYSDDEEEEDNDNSFLPKKTTTTTRRPIHFSSTTKSRILTTTHKPPAPLPSAAEEDPFYRLKNHCALNFDQLCSGKKSEMYELVLKCERLKLEHSNQRLEPCREVYSIYCYVFNDRFTCLGQDYDTYVPGRKKFTTSGTRTTTRSTSTVTIKINVITTSSYRPPVVTTTTRTTTRPTTRAVVTTTTKPTTRFVVTTTTTHRPTTKASSGGGSASGDPFGDGPVQIPNNADRLKEIGEFCLKTKTKNTKCDTMLKMLKDRFKTCEKKPKSDNECQSFKINFCTAYNNFPCCPDVLAGRSCSGKSNSQARRMLYM